jgi:S-layer homology domain
MTTIMMTQRVSAALVCAMLAASVSLTGCQPGPNKQLEELTAENIALKKQLETLEEKCAADSATLPAGSSLIENPQTPSPAAFSDVDASVPTAEMINDLAQLKVFEGMATFDPYKPMTRGEYVIWLFKAYNAQHPAEKQIRFDPGYTVAFADIKPSHAAYKYVQAFSSAGFSVGYDDKNFKPDKPLTREEMIAIKHGVDGGEMYSNVPTNFSDDAAIDKRFHNSVYSDEIFKDAKPRGNNIMRAFGPIKAFKPKEIVQRYQAAGTLWQTDHRGRVTADTALGRPAAE